MQRSTNETLIGEDKTQVIQCLCFHYTGSFYVLSVLSWLLSPPPPHYQRDLFLDQRLSGALLKLRADGAIQLGKYANQRFGPKGQGASPLPASPYTAVRKEGVVCQCRAG